MCFDFLLRATVYDNFSSCSHISQEDIWGFLESREDNKIYFILRLSNNLKLKSRKFYDGQHEKCSGFI